MASFARWGRECHGASIEKDISWASAVRTLWKYSDAPLVAAQGATAPWARERSSSGTISSGSTSSSVPIPVHFGQAPNGLLKEKDRGSISSIVRG